VKSFSSPYLSQINNDIHLVSNSCHRRNHVLFLGREFLSKNNQNHAMLPILYLRREHLDRYLIDMCFQHLTIYLLFLNLKSSDTHISTTLYADPIIHHLAFVIYHSQKRREGTIATHPYGTFVPLSSRADKYVYIFFETLPHTYSL